MQLQMTSSYILKYLAWYSIVQKTKNKKPCIFQFTDVQQLSDEGIDEISSIPFWKVTIMAQMC